MVYKVSSKCQMCLGKVILLTLKSKSIYYVYHTKFLAQKYFTTKERNKIKVEQ